MSTPFIGEIRITPYTFTPLGWLACDGSLQSISNFEPLFNLLGTTYGGDGQNTFGLPDLRGRVPVHQGNDGAGNAYSLGQQGGQAAVTLTATQMGTHTHSFQASGNAADKPGPGSAYPASGITGGFYSTDNNPGNFAILSPNSTSVVGGSQPHNNLMPFLCANFIIAAEGLYPVKP